MESTQRNRTDALQILLIEDNPGDARLFNELVRESGQAGEVRWEEDLASGLAAVEERRPDVIAVDLGLPDSEGVQAIERIVESVPELPIVVLTGQQSEELALSTLDAGATEYLRKAELTPSLLARTLRWAVERKSMEQRLGEREQQLQSIIENISEGIYRSVPGEGLVYVNQAFAEMFGYESPEEIASVDPVELYVRPERREELRGILRSEGHFQNEEVECRRKDGSTFTVLQSGSVVRDEEGEVRFYDGAVQDITDRKEAERALKRSEELHRATLSNITDAVLLTDADGRFTYVCPNVGYIFDWSEEEVEALGSISALLGSDPAEEHDFEDAQEISNVEHSVVDASGDRHDLLINVRRVAIQDGRRMYTCRDITERKRAEEALREREEYLSVTLQSIGDAVIATDGDGCVTEMNSVAERLTGWSQEEAEGKRLDDVLTLHSAQTGESVESPADEVLRAGETVGLANHTVLTSRDGTEHQIADSAAPIQSEEGDLLGVVLVFRDVTETYERRRQMERQNDLFSKAQDLAQVGAWEYDVRSEETIWTEEVYRIHGLPLDAEPSPEQSLQFYHEDDRPVIEEAFARAVEEGEPYDLELRLRTTEGEERWVRTRGEPQTEDGDVVRVRGTIQDVTDQKKYEEELERTTNLLRLAEEMTDVGGWSVDVRGERPYQAEWTDHLYDLFGLPSGEEPPTEEVFEYYHPEDRERHREAVYRAEQTGGGWDQELRLLRADGAERWVHNIGIPITEGGEVVELRGAVQDITKRKEREQELRKAKEEAERMNQLKNAFLANMSHEIRTPLTSIIGFAEIIGDEVATLEPQDTEFDLSTLSRYSSLIRKGGQRLMGTLEDVLNLSKLEAGEMNLSEETVDLGEEAREIVEQFELQAQQAGLALRAESPEEVVRARVDPEGLRIALRNLVNNATKYTEEGGQVWVRVRREEDASVMEVEDTGIGMDPERVPELFEAFVQESEGIGRAYEGSGLGLAVTKRVIDQMGGSIDVATEKGAGSRFTLRFPRAKG